MKPASLVPIMKAERQFPTTAFRGKGTGAADGPAPLRYAAKLRIKKKDAETGRSPHKESRSPP